MIQPDFVLVANSPGELSALVKPVTEELAVQKKGRVILVLTPCQYTSGKETEYIKGIKEIKSVVTAAEYKNWAFLNRKPKGIKFAEKGVVLFLGGDLAHAMVVAKKLKYPAYAYLGERIAWKSFYQKFFVPDQETYNKFAKQAPAGKLKVVGNLMVDSISDLKSWEPKANVITFMPGSRKWEIDYMTPLYKQVMSLIRKEVPGSKFQVVNSPFVKSHPIDGAKTVEFDDIQNSELVVTIPGTNTAKIAARGIPMAVVFPLNHPEVIPMEGLAEIIGRVLIVGKHFKKLVANIINRKTRFFALPNQKAGRQIVPEIRGVIEPAEVALLVVSLLKDKKKRAEMSADLIKSMGKPGAAKKIVEELHAGI